MAAIKLEGIRRNKSLCKLPRIMDICALHQEGGNKVPVIQMYITNQ